MCVPATIAVLGDVKSSKVREQCVRALQVDRTTRRLLSQPRRESRNEQMRRGSCVQNGCRLHGCTSLDLALIRMPSAHGFQRQVRYATARVFTTDVVVSRSKLRYVLSAGVCVTQVVFKCALSECTKSCRQRLWRDSHRCQTLLLAPPLTLFRAIQFRTGRARHRNFETVSK